MEALDGTRSGSLRRSSKCATCGSTSDPKRYVPKRYAPTKQEERTVTISVAAARKPRPGTRSSPAKTRDNPKKRHAPVKKAIHRSDSLKVTSTAQKKVPPSAPRHDREDKSRASPTTQGPSKDKTNSTKTYRKKESGNAGTSSQERGSTSRPSTTSTDESIKQKGAKAYGIASILTERLNLLRAERCSTKRDAPRLKKASGTGPTLTNDDLEELEAAGMLHFEDLRALDKAGMLPEPGESYPESIGHCSDAPIGPSDVESDDDERSPAYKEVRAYVASTSNNDAHAPLLECLKVTAVNPTTGATRNVIVFFDGGSDFSYLSSTLARDLDLPFHGKCVLRVNTFGTPAPLTAEGFSTSVALRSPQGRLLSLGASTANFAIPRVRTALVQDADLPSLRRNERHLTPSQVTPDILIGQDCIQLFGRKHGPRLPSGYDIAHTILGPMVGGAPQVVSSQLKALPSSSATSDAEVPKPFWGSIPQPPSGIDDASTLQAIDSPSRTPSDSPPFDAEDHLCLQNEHRGDTTSTALCAERLPMPKRTERWKLLRRKRNPLDTVRPPQSGLNSTYAVLQPELQLGHQLSAEDDQQTPATLQLGLLQRKRDPPTRPVETARRSVMPHDGDSSADSTRDRHHPQHHVTEEDTHYNNRATTKADAHSSRPSVSRFGPLPITDSTGAERDNVPPLPDHQSRPRYSRFGPLPIADSPGAGVEELPPRPAHQRKPSTSRFGPLPIADGTGARPHEVPQQPARHSRLNASRSGLLLVRDSTTAEAITTPQHPATQMKSTRSDPDPLPEKDRGAGHATQSARKRTDAAPTPALAVLVPVARADPKDQEENAFHVAPSNAANADRARVPGSQPTSTTRCAPANPLAFAKQATAAPRSPADDTTSSAARTPSKAPTAMLHSYVARRPPAEATQEQAASTQDDDTHVRRTTRDDSPLKNETVCFCDGTTFLYFGCLLRPEVLMILTPMSSVECAFRSVRDFHPSNEVKRVIFWLSDSHATPLSTADQLRLVTELSRHYATQHPTVMQYIVATPMNDGSRQHGWTCGLFKLLVQMQVLLPRAHLILRPRGTRSITWIGVHFIKLYLRDYYHLDLWSGYDAESLEAVEALYFPAQLQQLAMPRAATSAAHLAAETPEAAGHWSQRQPLPTKASSNPKNGTASAAIAARPAHPPDESGFRQIDNLRDGSAAQPIVQFPPPPSRSRFRSTPLSANLYPAQAQYRKSQSRPKPAVLAARDPPKTDSRGKKKEHALRDEVHQRSKDKPTPAAPAATSKKPAKPKPSKSRFGPCRSWIKLWPPRTS